MPAMMVCVGLCWRCGGNEEVELRNDVGLAQGQLPVQDVEELPFHTTNIALSKQSGPCRPIDVLR